MPGWSYFIISPFIKWIWFQLGGGGGLSDVWEDWVPQARPGYAPDYVCPFPARLRLGELGHASRSKGSRPETISRSPSGRYWSRGKLGRQRELTLILTRHKATDRFIVMIKLLYCTFSSLVFYFCTRLEFTVYTYTDTVRKTNFAPDEKHTCL